MRGRVALFIWRHHQGPPNYGPKGFAPQRQAVPTHHVAAAFLPSNVNFSALFSFPQLSTSQKVGEDSIASKRAAKGDSDSWRKTSKGWKEAGEVESWNVSQFPSLPRSTFQLFAFSQLFHHSEVGKARKKCEKVKKLTLEVKKKIENDKRKSRTKNWNGRDVHPTKNWSSSKKCKKFKR